MYPYRDRVKKNRNKINLNRFPSQIEYVLTFRLDRATKTFELSVHRQKLTRKSQAMSLFWCFDGDSL